ncbi:hypothetical protein [Encephalitozoon cuniculi GB-M1]|uniref:Uncharacterized protein n=2 Tax=Encephalitozoon cuniculi TaxID=6035 RepID=Q8SW24_ENCCU|nr:uncharacterized protein ECU03_1060 [Encephalitozoon cuniculi GB-M1]AGE95963.1 hypothetical protein ECU03_1060 [Encephalitozoon cuniculi]KMV66468.1 hypothetical protein M970_030980 [Encephalitozoon cuniculi EcunIII-L]CAD26250.1 hypothetical protein [Encephalitozoon cuniculi GB-M1]
MEKRRTRVILKEALKIAFLGLCIYGTLDYAFQKETIEMIRSNSGGKFLYLTFISLHLTIISTILGYLIEVGLGKRLEHIYKDLLALSFSLEGIVTILFWTLYWTKPTLLKNKTLYESGIQESFLTEISQHLIPLLLLLICQADVKLQRKKRCICFIFGFGTLYFLEIWYFSTKNDKKWAYPMFNKMAMVYRILFIFAACLIGVASYMCLLEINSLAHQKHDRASESD